jgi:hypothetical protein
MGQVCQVQIHGRIKLQYLFKAVQRNSSSSSPVLGGIVVKAAIGGENM